MVSQLLGFNEAPKGRPALDHALVEVARLRRVQRDELVANRPSVTVAMVADARGTSEGAVRTWVHRQRAGGQIVTVDHGSTTLIPAFQLTIDLDPRPDVAPAVARMVAAGMDGWAVWTWWTSHNAVLDDVPIDVLNAGDGQAVADAVDRLLDPHG